MLDNQKYIELINDVNDNLKSRPGQKTAAMMLGQNIKDGNLPGIKIQLAKIKTDKSIALLSELEGETESGNSTLVVEAPSSSVKVEESVASRTPAPPPPEFMSHGVPVAESSVVEGVDEDLHRQTSDDARSEADEIILVKAEKLHPHPFVAELFMKNDDVLEAIKQDMSEKGFDQAHPLIGIESDGEILIVDGNTRLSVAQKVIPSTKIPVVLKVLDDSAIKLLAVKEQTLRRNTSDAVLLTAVQTVVSIFTEKAKQDQGRRSDLCQSSGRSGIRGSDGAIALSLGVNRDKVRQARRLLDIQEGANSVWNDGLSINAAYERFVKKSSTHVEPLVESSSSESSEREVAAAIASESTEMPENSDSPSPCVPSTSNHLEATDASDITPSTASLTEQPVRDLSAIELLSAIPENAMEIRGAVLLIDLSACPEKVAELFKKRFSILEGE